MRWSGHLRRRRPALHGDLGDRAGGRSPKWIPDIVAKAKTLKVNVGTDKGADLGPVISKNAKNRILGLVEEGVKEGAKLELDGRGIKVPVSSRAISSARPIFSGVKTSMKIYTQEIFGPVMVIVGVEPWMRPSSSSTESVRQRHRHLHAKRRRGTQVPA
jgi:hypothetical protein